MAFIRRTRVATIALLASFALGQEPTDRPFGFDESTLPVLTRSVTIFGAASYQLPTTAGLKWKYEYTNEVATDFVQLRIVALNSPGAKWWILVFDQFGRQQDRIDSSEFLPVPPSQSKGSSQSNARSQWTRSVPGRAARIELWSEEALEKLQIRVERCNYQFTEPAPKVMVEGVPLVDLATFPKTSNYYQWSKPIAYIYFQKPGTNAGSNCTGFLIAPTLLVTNHHCIYLDSQLRTAYAAFNYETGEPTPPSLHIRLIEATNTALDYSLLRIDPPAPPIDPVKLASSAVHNGEPLVLIQHPNYQPKQISRNCSVEVDQTVGAQAGLFSDFFHICSSQGGASGSPVMDGSTGQVVGLHHAGKWKDDVKAYHNLGVKIPLILKDLDQQKYSKLRAEIRQSQQM
jgi:hypothetical protein